jgi:hypothetical protein
MLSCLFIISVLFQCFQTDFDCYFQVILELLKNESDVFKVIPLKETVPLLLMETGTCSVFVTFFLYLLRSYAITVERKI